MRSLAADLASSTSWSSSGPNYVKQLFRGSEDCVQTAVKACVSWRLARWTYEKEPYNKLTYAWTSLRSRKKPGLAHQPAQGDGDQYDAMARWDFLVQPLDA